MYKQQLETIWIVVKVAAGIPVTAEAFRNRDSAEMRVQSLRTQMHPENDRVAVFESRIHQECA